MKIPDKEKFWQMLCKLSREEITFQHVENWLYKRKMFDFYMLWGNDDTIATCPTYEEYSVWYSQFSKLGKCLNEGKDE
jgi:hypothetical protein